MSDALAVVVWWIEVQALGLIIWPLAFRWLRSLPDRAAFDPIWWHSAASIEHILRTVSHFVIAEIDGRIVGHASSDVYGGQGHLSSHFIAATAIASLGDLCT